MSNAQRPPPSGGAEALDSAEAGIKQPITKLDRDKHAHRERQASRPPGSDDYYLIVSVSTDDAREGRLGVLCANN
jgi:hypothetical protein